MRVACITDTHISFKKSNLIFHNYFEKFYKNIFFPELQRRNIKTVIHLGDAFDNRKGIDYWGLEWAQRVVYDKFKELGITVYQICGNHDVQMKTTNKHNAIATLLRDYNNVIPIVSPVEMKIDNVPILFLPWICKDNQEESYNLIQNSSSKIIFGHLELSGFSLFPGQSSNSGINKKIFENYDRVFSGHYHTRSNDGKIFYLGNPYQMFWNDLNDDRGFSIFDINSYELEFINNPYNIFERIYYNDSKVEDFDFETFVGKYVKLIVTKKTNLSDYEYFLSKLSKIDINDLKIVDIPEIDDSSVDLVDMDPEDTLTTLNKYIEESDFNLDKNMIKKIIHNIYYEALEVEG